MIRFLISLSLIFSLIHLSACTSSGSDGSSDESGAISDSDLSDSQLNAEPGEEGDLAKNDSVTDEATVDESATEDDLDAEFENQASDQSKETSELGADLGDDDLAEAAPEAAPPEVTESVQEPVPAPVIEEKTRIRDIRYIANSSGGTVVIESSKPVQYQTRLNASARQFVIEIADVELPSSLQKPLPIASNGSRVGGINAYQSEGSNTARVVIQLASNVSGEPIVQQEGTSIVVIPPSAPLVAETVSEPPVVAPVAAPSSSGTVAPRSLGARTLDEFLTGNQVFYGKPISLQVKDADVRDVVNFLAEESGANVVISDDVNGKISLKLRKIPWDQALVTVMRSKALGYVRQGNVLRISTMKTLQSEAEAASKIMEAQKAIVPDVVQVLAVSYAELDDLAKNVAPFLSKDGKVIADKRTSTLVVTDKVDVVDRVKRLVKTLDVAPPQVSIESKIVEAAETFSSFVGVNWGLGGATTQIGQNGNGSKINFGSGLAVTTVNSDTAGASPLFLNLSVGTIDGLGNLTAALALAQLDSLAKVISAPHITAMNREKSTIRQEGENVTISSTRNEASNTTTTTEKRTPFALELNVTPQITADGAVIMEVDVRREFPGPMLDKETQARAINKRSAKTRVLVKNGQTAVIGGIYSSDELESNSGVPGLKDVPILGWLFKSKNIERNKNELLIFLTPRIISSDLGVSVATAKDIGED